MEGKRKIVELALAAKVEVLNQVDKGYSCRKIAESFGICISTVSSMFLSWRSLGMQIERPG